jgi:hypothetical protein
MFSATKSFFAKAPPRGGGPTPSWSIDWSTGNPSGYTLTRTGTGATFVDSSGYIASAAADVARLTHNSSGTRLGLLVEQSRTNNLQRSEAFDNAYWTKAGLLAFGSGSTADAATAPDNTTTADLITESSGGTNHNVLRTYGTLNAGTTWTWSCFIKKPASNGRDFATMTLNGAGGHNLVRSFDLTDGTSTQNSQAGANFTNGTGGSEDYGNGWYRCWIQVTIGASNVTSVSAIACISNSETPTLTAGAYPNYSGDGVSGILLWGAQLEEGEKPTAYIPTTTATATRSADLAHVLDSSITSWGDPGALVIHFYPPGQSGTLLSTDDASAEQLGLQASSTTAARAFWSSGSTSTGTIGSSGVQKAVHYWNGTNSRFCINGGTVESSTNNITTFGNIDYVTFGAEATSSTAGYSQYANCIIRYIAFYSGTLTDANLQTITT